ncbi:MAG: PLD nuclease N-terminal domain-containing protein [Phycisphaerales bacterium]
MHSGPDPAGVFAGMFMLIPCCFIVVGLAQLVFFLVTLIQILSNHVMATDKKILWLLVCWFLPLIGCILFWTIGRKDAQGPGAP